MTVKRFKKILNDNSEAPKRGENGYDKLYKFRPLIDKLNQEFHRQCVATSSQSIDEAMILFKGRSSLKQYMPMKPIKRGYVLIRQQDMCSNLKCIYITKEDCSTEAV